MINPLCRAYLEGGPDEGITAPQSRLSSLEYTNLPYGTYTLHLQVLDKTTKDVIQDDSFLLRKEARFRELLPVRVALLILVGLASALVVWQVIRSTVLARQYEEIRRANEEAERANRARSRFLANLSDELHTPINTIMGMNEMAMREDPTGVPKDYLRSVTGYAQDIRGASEYLLRLIDDLLDISRIDSGKLQVTEQEYDVADLLRSVVSGPRAKSSEKGLTFDTVIDEMLPRRLCGDVGKIRQILLNLLANAVQYTDAGGIVLSVSMEERRGETASLRFSVKDTGIGVKEGEIEKLFTAYERLDDEKDNGTQGTGLGLDISRQFAERMGGALRCESVYGEGSEFVLTLDQKIVDATPIGEFTEQEDRAAGGPYVPLFVAPDADILVVDDNQMNLSVIRGLLKATRVFVTAAASGEDALMKIRSSHFDVVFMDHTMLRKDGFEAVKKIRALDKELPVYLITASAAAGEAFYKSRGFYGCLSKPIDGRTLERTVMRHLPGEMMEKPAKENA
jgi:signal transduction histidine kinase/CheY-like chemotaxis protein